MRPGESPLRRARAQVRLLGVVTVLVLLTGIVAAVVEQRSPDRSSLVRAEPPPSTSTSASVREPSTTAVSASVPETTAPTTTTTAAPTTTSTAAPPPTPTSSSPEPVVGTAATRAEGSWTIAPYRGLGAWVDVYDWTHEFTREAEPRVGPGSVDAMSASGVETIYIQTAHRRSDADVIEPARLAAIVDRAHAHGMAVVAWYLPTLEDVEVDLRRLAAGASAGVDGVAVDIEARHVADHRERNRRLLELSRRLRELVGDRAIGAITPSAVHLQVVNPAFWPEFPWVETAQLYDVILPMAYFTVRRGEYRSGERYIGENIDRIRASTGDPAVAIHPIGGIADQASVADLDGMVRAATTRGVIGASLYDWATSRPEQWVALGPFRSG